ncbi:MAG: hypothetical protein E6H05_03095 [Bacillati bacterium ANGP1]|uniref:Uncharacterized protein n=1 Tax=Candidatus Segetimicrobium genomatis TaxID=2569760 RepID=A0A537IZA7_9BACT|nr:MAG: hypothetical protein E6H05_03095 [Terrabacteria group bacterium ANGP1]
MRGLAARLVIATMLVAVFLSQAARAAAPEPVLALSDVGHALDGDTLIITGWVTNRGMSPVPGLVIDARGFSPSGDLIAFGSDGIPWGISPGQAERFSVFVPVPGTLIRDYTLAVSVPRVPVRPLAGVRRSVDVALYRSLVLSRVRVVGDVDVGQLTLRSDVRGLPVAQLTVEATVILKEPKINLLQTLTVTLLPDASEAFEIGGKRAILVSIRVVDVLLRTVWD